jgi:hypothetical protein
MRAPLSWLCHQETLPYFGGQIGGNVIPLHAHGHNRSSRDETSYPSTSTLSVYVMLWVPFSYREYFHYFLGDPWVKHIEGFKIGF